jgi:dTDP-glucose pyrophosphorylase
MPDTTIILCGGQINFTNLPIGSNLSNAMIPVNGKPVLGWILDDLLTKEIHSTVIVLRESNHRLAEFVQRGYAHRMEIKLARLTQEGTIVQSLRAGLAANPAEGIVRIVLGDTLIRDPFDGPESFVYVDEVQESRRWCLAVAERDGRILNYLDKQEIAPKPYLALAGYYHFTEGETLQHCVDAAVADGARELSEVLQRYGSLQPVYAKRVQSWFDFGNADNLVAARQRLLQPRYFNALNINPILGTITKASKDSSKLHDELQWYLDLPEELKVLAPRIVSHTEEDGQLRIVQEYYGYPTLAELYVYGELHLDTWASILRRVLAIHREFVKFNGTLEPKQIEAVYLDKTFARVYALLQEERWRELLEAEEIVFNGIPLRSWKRLQDDVKKMAQRLAQNAPVSVVHGDYCFSNILYDLGNQIVRLIDPRGSFGKKGIYGDARYDIAKLRHSICEGYDFIIADMFDLQGNDGRYEGRIFHGGRTPMLGALFDRSVCEMGYALDEIRFIEGLLFISMLPLHRDQPRRQTMMLLTGLSLLNEVLECELPLTWTEPFAQSNSPTNPTPT